MIADCGKALSLFRLSLLFLKVGKKGGIFKYTFLIMMMMIMMMMMMVMMMMMIIIILIQ